MGEPIILNKPDTGKYATLRSTGNFKKYLDCLKEYKKDIVVIVAAKRGIGQCVNDIIVNKLYDLLGGTTRLLQNKSASYIAVIKNGNVLYNSAEAGKNCFYNNGEYSVTSTFSGNAEQIKICINDVNYAINCDGLNFVIIDCATGNVEDTVSFDTAKPFFTCRRLLPELAVKCCNKNDKDKYIILTEYLTKALNLEKNKRVALFYFDNLGDYYTLCLSVRNAEMVTGTECILLYDLERGYTMASWFSSDDYKVKLYKIGIYEREIIQRCTVFDTENLKKCNDVLYRWQNAEIFKLTANVNKNINALNLRPDLPEFDKQSYINKYGIKEGKTVLIVPSSTGVMPLPEYFWNFCAEIFKMIGLTVVFNVPDNEAEKFKGANVFVPLEDAVGFADLCGYVFGMRTGFIDIISSSQAKFVIFSTSTYPSINEVYNIPNGDGRIKTIYIDEDDAGYETTFPLNILTQYFKRFNNDSIIKELISYLPDSKTENKKSVIAKTYTYARYGNKYVPSRNTSVINYSLDYIDGLLILKLQDVTDNSTYVDVQVFCNGKICKQYAMLYSAAIVFRPEADGLYHFTVSITNKKDKIKKEFTTEKYMVSVCMIKDYNELSNCINYITYLKGLINLSSESVIFITSRDAHTTQKAEESITPSELFSQLGIKTDLKTTFRHSYICVIDGGKVVDEMSSATGELFSHYCKDGVDAQIASRGWNCVKSANAPVEIKINGIQYAVNKRGLNIVVWDKRSEKVADSVAIDFFKDGSIVRQ